MHRRQPSEDKKINIPARDDNNTTQSPPTPAPAASSTDGDKAKSPLSAPIPKHLATDAAAPGHTSPEAVVPAERKAWREKIAKEQEMKEKPKEKGKSPL